MCHHSATDIRAGYGLVNKRGDPQELIAVTAEEPWSGALVWKDVRGVDGTSWKSSRSMWGGNTFGRWLR